MKGIDEDPIWVDEADTLAPDPDQYPNPAIGKKHGLCHCAHCGWKGHESKLQRAWNNTARTKRRPIGYCPECSQRPFWLRMTKAQAALLAP